MKSLILLFALCALPLTSAFALSSVEAEAKAKEIADVATSDVVYSQEINKALYYQNIQSIALLTEIRDLLKENLNRLNAGNNQSSNPE